MLNLDDVIKRINLLDFENKNKQIINQPSTYQLGKKPDAYKNINSSSIININNINNINNK
jgi:hypothetical protein